MNIKPRKWQAEALRKFMIATTKPFLLNATPGAGKTIFSALLAQWLFGQKLIDFAITVVPTTTIKGDKDAGFLGDWNKAGIQITTVLKEGKAAPKEFQGAVITYQQLPNMIGSFSAWVKNGTRLFVIFDEIHHASEDNAWGSATESLGRMAVRILGMTGTAFRGDERPITFVSYDKSGKAIADFTYSYREAVADRVCREINFITDDSVTEFTLDAEEYKTRVSEAKSGDQLSGATRTVFRADQDFLQRVLEKADAKLDEYRTWDYDAGGMIVCRSGKDDSDERHLHHIATLTNKVLGEAPEVISYDDKDANAKIERFRKSKLQRWICSVRKLSEGVDIKRLRVQVMAMRPTTELLFRQLIGRIARVDDEDNPGDAVVYIAKFPTLMAWAEQIAAEAKAGIKDRENKGGNGGNGDKPEPRPFTARSATHEDGGAVSDFGDRYTSDEIRAAENLRGGDPQLRSVSITTLAYLQRKLGIVPTPEETTEEPLQLQKKKIRGRIVKKQRALALRRNANNPDFSLVWREITQLFGPKSADDLTDNYSIDVMNKVESWLIAKLAQEDVKNARNN